MKTREVHIAGKKVVELEVPLPVAPLVLVYGERGFVMCGYLNVEVADRLGVAAAIVSGVSTVEDLLKGPVKAVSKLASERGVTVGMSGQDALAKLI